MAARKKASTPTKTRKKPTATRKKASPSASSSGGSTQSSIYSKLIKKGMSPKQAAAFSKQAAKRAKKK